MLKDPINEGHYIASEGKIIVPKVRDKDTEGTKSIWLSSWDSIDNYEEIDEPVEDETEDKDKKTEEN